MSEVIHIIGHKNPDTDSIAASLAYAELKNALKENAIACRIGDINPETAFVLKRFHVQEPVYIQNAKVKLYDVPFDEAIILPKEATIREAWDRMSVSKTKTVYVIDKEEKLLGLVSLSDITRVLMNDVERHAELMRNTEPENIARVVKGEILYRPQRYHSDGRVHVLASRKAIHSELDFKHSIVVLSDDLALQKRVIGEKAGCLILVDVDIVSQSMLRMAEEYGCCIIRTDMDMLNVSRNIYKSPSIDLIMQRKIISFNNHAYIDDAYKKMSKSRYRSYPVLNNQGKVLGSIARFHLLNYKKKKLILVDHNEVSQSIDNIEDAEVLEIVDHHRIGDVETTTPIRFRNEIIGSTCSIIAQMFKEEGKTPKPETAAVMCCAIISDTMNFNSPTTTKKDRLIADELAKIAGINLDEVAHDMFGAVATLQGRSESEILYNDFKEYNIDGKRIAIGQINIADEEEVRAIREDFLMYMEKINSINKFDLMMMCFTDVEGRGSNLLFVGPFTWIVDETFKEDIMNELYFVDGVISRKKQIIPMLSKTLTAN